LERELVQSHGGITTRKNSRHEARRRIGCRGCRNDSSSRRLLLCWKEIRQLALERKEPAEKTGFGRNQIFLKKREPSVNLKRSRGETQTYRTQFLRR